MKSQRSEVLSRLARFVDMDNHGLRKCILLTIVETRQFTVNSLHETVSQKFEVSKKVVASMIGYICSRLGILRVNKASYRSPKTYILRDEYADIARSVLSDTI
jgi:hypothetical protein